jgi:hypothetical protein
MTLRSEYKRDLLNGTRSVSVSISMWAVTGYESKKIERGVRHFHDRGCEQRNEMGVCGGAACVIGVGAE